MSLYTIGDLHLSLGTDKPMDIFRGWENYVDRLSENWNNTVGEDDTVVIVGDISWAIKLERTYEDFDFINNRLNGQKIIIKGNHDYWWSTHAKMNRYLEQNSFQNIKILSNNSFSCDGIRIVGTRGWINETEIPADKQVLLRESGRLELSITHSLSVEPDGEMVAFLHYPPIYADERNYFMLDVLKKYGIKKCFYGHIHGSGARNAFVGEYDGINFSMVSADFVDFTPQIVKNI